MHDFVCSGVTAGVSDSRDARDYDRNDAAHDVSPRHGFGTGCAFLPDVLSLVHEIDFITSNERRLLSQIQGRTYANIAALFGQYKAHGLDGPAVMPRIPANGAAGSRETEFLQQVDETIAREAPRGYRFVADTEKFIRSARTASAWARLALGYHIDLSAQAHYKLSSDRDEEIAPLFREVIRTHWLAESQTAIADGIEWARIDASLNRAARESAVHDLVNVFKAIDECLQRQAAADADYFLRVSGRAFGAARRERLSSQILAAYRWQHIVIGFNNHRYLNTLAGFVTERQVRGLCELFGKVSHQRTLH